MDYGERTCSIEPGGTSLPELKNSRPQVLARLGLDQTRVLHQRPQSVDRDLEVLLRDDGAEELGLEGGGGGSDGGQHRRRGGVLRLGLLHPAQLLLVLALLLALLLGLGHYRRCMVSASVSQEEVDGYIYELRVDGWDWLA